MGSAPAAVKKRSLRIASGCATKEAFVAVFRRFCDRETIFIATRTPKPTDHEMQFVVTLSDGTELISGNGRVVECFADDKGPHGRPGMKIRFLDITPASKALVEEVVAAGLQAKRPPRASGPVTVPAPGPKPPLAPQSKPPLPPLTKPLPSVVKPLGGPRPDLKSATLMLTPVVPVKPAAAEPFPSSEASDAEKDWETATSGPTRVRGGSTILPANPLGQMETSIEDFVDCTLYEETGAFGEGEPTSPATVTGLTDDWQEGDQTIPPWLAGPVPIEMQMADSVALSADRIRDHDQTAAGTPSTKALAATAPLTPIVPIAAPPKRARSDTQPRLVPLPSGKTPPPEFTPVPELIPVVERRDRAELSGELYTAAPKVMVDAGDDAAADRASGSSDSILITLRRSHWRVTIAIACAAAAAGVFAGYLIGRSSSRGAPAATDEAASASAEAAPASPPPTPVPDGDEPAAVAGDPAAEEPAEEETPTGDGAAVAVAFKGRLDREKCGATIDSEPRNSRVYLGDQRIGATPLRVTLPCGANDFVVKRSRYRDRAAHVELRAGKLRKMRVTLLRPDHKIRVSSTPKGARVTVAGRALGAAPVVATVPGYEHVSVRVELAGYEPFTTRVYARAPSTAVAAKLTPLPPPPPRPVVKPPVRAPVKPGTKPTTAGATTGTRPTGAKPTTTAPPR